VNLNTGAPEVTSLADLYAIAYQIEADAVERYTMLAEQMQTHNNPELAGIFSELARVERIHRDEIASAAADPEIVAHARRVAPWHDGESPEAADLSEAHYLMTPRDAIEMALAGEELAFDFYNGLCDARDPDVKRLAAEFVAEELEQVALCRSLLGRYPAPAPSERWVFEDPDPPVSQE
jgi:rubrerythrin